MIAVSEVGQDIEIDVVGLERLGVMLQTVRTQPAAKIAHYCSSSGAARIGISGIRGVRNFSCGISNGESDIIRRHMGLYFSTSAGTATPSLIWPTERMMSSPSSCAKQA